MACCKMREKFLIGIIAENSTLPDPVDAVDFIDFNEHRDDGKPVIRIAFCPFCGVKLAGPLRVGDPPKVLLFDPSTDNAFMQELRFLLLSNGFWFDETKDDQKAALIEGCKKAFEKCPASLRAWVAQQPCENNNAGGCKCPPCIGRDWHGAI